MCCVDEGVLLALINRTDRWEEKKNLKKNIQVGADVVRL